MSNCMQPHGRQHARLRCISLSSQSLPKFLSAELVMLSIHFILCRPLLRPSIFRSIRIFSSELALHIRWPMYWSFSFIISPSNEYSCLISLGLTGLISLQSKGLSKNLLQQHRLKASILWCSRLLYSPALTSVHYYWRGRKKITNWQATLSILVDFMLFNPKVQHCLGWLDFSRR